MPKTKLKPVPICIICGKPITDQQKCSKVHKGECSTLWQRERDKKKWAERAVNQEWKQERFCVVCQDPFMPKQPHQLSCDKDECRKTMKRNRKQRERISPGMVAPARPEKCEKGYWSHAMNCPWEHALFDTQPAHGASWYGAEADPMTAGAWGCDTMDERKEARAA